MVPEVDRSGAKVATSADPGGVTGSGGGVRRVGRGTCSRGNHGRRGAAGMGVTSPTETARLVLGATRLSTTVTP